MERCPRTGEIDGGGTGTATSFSPAYSNSGELLTGLTAVSSDVSRTTSSPPSVCAGVRYDPSEAKKGRQWTSQICQPTSHLWEKPSDPESTRLRTRHEPQLPNAYGSDIIVRSLTRPEHPATARRRPTYQPRSGMSSLGQRPGEVAPTLVSSSFKALR